MRLIVAAVAFILCLGVAHGTVLADGPVLIEPMYDAGPVAAAPAVVVPDPVAQPAESASLLWNLYKAGHLVPALIVFGFMLLTALQRYVSWLRVGWRKLAVTATLAGLGMVAERAASGQTPNAAMLAGALGVVLSAVMNFKGEAAG